MVSLFRPTTSPMFWIRKDHFFGKIASESSARRSFSFWRASRSFWIACSALDLDFLIATTWFCRSSWPTTMTQYHSLYHCHYGFLETWRCFLTCIGVYPCIPYLLTNPNGRTEVHELYTISTMVASLHRSARPQSLPFASVLPKQSFHTEAKFKLPEYVRNTCWTPT